ncbi:hypothetical protein BALAC2494_00094 [Bifidobacterium animalis subsp. lactis CNCM I-2494]|nr:hypothetical protein BALAC2494_00094 [Bifidobacterium animalis subsp. lactis CNCM I-2494]KOA43822.1 hypothetical protein BAAA27536_07630 [Bifidobacterium animalis subsp. lactis ATCC 27536]KOA45625.1 hypothetical protein BAAA27673_06840 [Bifidobacterium animalis subsp. lactis ATCC 27673]KOA50374.1 hypothetical protein BAAA27674_05805 [Bifidobacterium animalis subsp. lactis ATCC 27674]
MSAQRCMLGGHRFREGARMRLPERIPVGARVVVRITDGVDEYTGRHQYRDYVGHVRAWDGRTLQLTRDAAANGSRPAQDVDISATDIAILKPVPERPAARR